MKLEIITDKNIWEEFLTGSNLPVSFFQSFAWGEFEQAQAHKVHRFGIYIDEELKGVFQAVEIHARRGSFLHIRNGPVFNWGNNEKVRELVELIKAEALVLKCDFVRMSPLLEATPQNEELLDDLKLKLSQMHDVDAEITWVLDLEEEESQLLANMRKSTRYLIKQAQKLPQLTIRISNDPKDLVLFWPVYKDTVKRQKWHAYDFSYLTNEFQYFHKNDAIRIFLAEYEGKVIAASLFIYYLDEVYYHHSGSLSDFKKIPAMYLLHWESIKYAKSRGFKKYNFFGIARNNDPKHPWAGLSLFKQGFGGRKQEWVHARDLPLTKKYWLTHFFEKVERKRRGYS
jgi:lipid II:glycine glycyltransferase (peptidoglycan interpeptide bridge formation enzyme)